MIVSDPSKMSTPQKGVDKQSRRVLHNTHISTVLDMQNETNYEIDEEIMREYENGEAMIDWVVAAVWVAIAAGIVIFWTWALLCAI